MYIYNNSASTVNFNSVTGRSGSQSATGTANFGVESAMGLGIEVKNFGRHAWGYNFGIAIDSTRKVNSGTASFNGVTAYVYYMDPKPTLSVTTTYLEGIYTWEKIYVPVGLNFSAAELKLNDNSMYTTYGGVGFQTGIGGEINDHMSVEFLVKTISFDFQRTNGTYYYNYGTGNLTGAQISLKYNF